MQMMLKTDNLLTKKEQPEESGHLSLLESEFLRLVSGVEDEEE